MSSLHKFIEPNYLPEDYGGSRPKIDYSSADWFPVLNEIEEDIKGLKLNFLINYHLYAKSYFWITSSAVVCVKVCFLQLIFLVC